MQSLRKSKCAFAPLHPKFPYYKIYKIPIHTLFVVYSFLPFSFLKKKVTPSACHVTNFLGSYKWNPLEASCSAMQLNRYQH
jgi:hypothetical protein